MAGEQDTTAALIELERLLLKHKVHLLRGGYDSFTRQADELIAVCRRAMGVTPRMQEVQGEETQHG